jgi:hypothetical protein
MMTSGGHLPPRAWDYCRRVPTFVADGVKLPNVQSESVVANPQPPKSKLTGGQKWMITGLLVLQIPSSLIFYPIAAIFAITGIFAPIAMVLMAVGTWPFSFAMKCKDRWQRGGIPEGR